MAACAPTRPAPLADQIDTEIRSEGAGPAVRRMAADGDYDRVLAGIADGDTALIALSPKLAAGADAGASEALGIALARALPKNAAAVLAVLDQRQAAISEARVCGLPFVEGTITDIAAYRRDAEAAVRHVDTPPLQRSRMACIAALRQTGARVENAAPPRIGG